MLAGIANVRAATCRNSTAAMPNQIGIPEAGAVAAAVEGRRARKGVKR